MLSEKLKQAIDLVRSGEKAQARQLLTEILNQDPMNETAWLWFTDTLELDRDKKIALEGLLKINPQSQAARLGLEKLNTPPQVPDLKIPVETFTEDVKIAPQPSSQTSIDGDELFQEAVLPVPEPPALADKKPGRTIKMPGFVLRTLLGLLLVMVVGGSFYLFGLAVGLFNTEVECNCKETDAYMLRVDDRVRRWRNNQALYQLAEGHGDAPENTDFAQKLYDEERNDRVPVCLTELHENLLTTFEYHLKYGQALKAGDEKGAKYYREFQSGLHDQLATEFAGVKLQLDQLNCAEK